MTSLPTAWNRLAVKRDKMLSNHGIEGVSPSKNWASNNTSNQLMVYLPRKIVHSCRRFSAFLLQEYTSLQQESPLSRCVLTTVKNVEQRQFAPLVKWDNTSMVRTGWQFNSAKGHYHPYPLEQEGVEKLESNAVRKFHPSEFFYLEKRVRKQVMREHIVRSRCKAHLVFSLFFILPPWWNWYTRRS